MEVKARLDLPALMKECGLPMTAAEIGVCGGNNSVDLLKNGIEHIYCVDSWATIDVFGDGSFPQNFHSRNFKAAVKLLAPFKGRYTILRGMSSEMHKHIQNNTLGLVYIDADHTYNGCKEDIENYYPKLVAGGIMGFHDYVNGQFGVKLAVDEFAAAKGLEVHIIPESNPGDAGCWYRI